MAKLSINLRTRGRRQEEAAHQERARQDKDQARRDNRMTIGIIIGSIVFSALMISTVLYVVTHF